MGIHPQFVVLQAGDFRIHLDLEFGVVFALPHGGQLRPLPDIELAPRLLASEQALQPDVLGREAIQVGPHLQQDLLIVVEVRRGLQHQLHAER